MTEGDHMQALLLSLRLNERPLLQRVYESVPVDRIPVMAANLPRAYVSNMCVLLVTSRSWLRAIDLWLLASSDMLPAIDT